MPDEYQTIHKQASDFLENLVQKTGTFEIKKEIVPEGKQLDNYLGDLESCLRNKRNLNLENKRDLQYAASMSLRIRDIFKIHYWSDISKENWNLLYSGIKELARPEKITREGVLVFCNKLLKAKLTWLPVTERAEKI